MFKFIDFSIFLIIIRFYLTIDRFLKAKTQDKTEHIYCIKELFMSNILFTQNLRQELSYQLTTIYQLRLKELSNCQNARYFRKYFYIIIEIIFILDVQLSLKNFPNR